jgi:hypothetical protein
MKTTRRRRLDRARAIKDETVKSFQRELKGAFPDGCPSFLLPEEVAIALGRTVYSTLDFLMAMECRNLCKRINKKFKW